MKDGALPLCVMDINIAIRLNACMKTMGALGLCPFNTTSHPLLKDKFQANASFQLRFKVMFKKRTNYY